MTDTNAQNMPAAEHAIDARLVHGLLTDQHPDLAASSLRRVASGWDNEIFRLGDAYAVRLPRRATAASLVLNEQRWLPQLAPELPLPIPAPLRRGVPGRGYPWAWSVCPWFEGETAAEAGPEPLQAARDLGRFVVALHHAAPPDAPQSEVRGGALSGRSEAFDERIARLGNEVDGDAIRALWGEAVAVPRDPALRVWLHGDLHPANLVVREGRIAAVLDFGDLTAGDPATDLAVAWMSFAPDARAVFREAAGSPDDDTWARARGWALSHAIACLATSADNPRMRGVGARTLAHVLGEQS